MLSEFIMMVIKVIKMVMKVIMMVIEIINYDGVKIHFFGDEIHYDGDEIEYDGDGNLPVSTRRVLLQLHALSSTFDENACFPQAFSTHACW